MKSITKETIEIINTYFDNLNEVQLKDNLEILIAKQPELYETVVDFFEDFIGDEKWTTINYMYCFSIRCYEYYYGELKVINDEAITNIVEKWAEFYKYSRKKLTPSNIINEFKRAIRQEELSDELINFISNDKELSTIFNEEEKYFLKYQFLLTFDILNEQVKKNYPDNNE